RPTPTIPTPSLPLGRTMRRPWRTPTLPTTRSWTPPIPRTPTSSQPPTRPTRGPRPRRRWSTTTASPRPISTTTPRSVTRTRTSALDAANLVYQNALATAWSAFNNAAEAAAVTVLAANDAYMSDPGAPGAEAGLDAAWASYVATIESAFAAYLAASNSAWNAY